MECAKILTYESSCCHEDVFWSLFWFLLLFWSCKVRQLICKSHANFNYLKHSIKFTKYHVSWNTWHNSIHQTFFKYFGSAVYGCIQVAILLRSETIQRSWTSQQCLFSEWFRSFLPLDFSIHCFSEFTTFFPSSTFHSHVFHSQLRQSFWTSTNEIKYLFERNRSNFISSIRCATFSNRLKVYPFWYCFLPKVILYEYMHQFLSALRLSRSPPRIYNSIRRISFDSKFYHFNHGKFDGF